MTRSTPSDPAIFSSAPDTRLFQPLGSMESCRGQLETMLRTDAGLGLLIGPPGTGKSLLCQTLAESLKDPFEVVLLAESVPRDQLSLLQNILFHLNMPYKNFSEGELRLSLIDRLTQSAHGRAHGLILIVDEAQSLPNSILEEIRMITNIVRGGRSCVRTMLAGNHELEDRISQAGMESLAQRVAVRCYLHPFSQADTAAYIRSTLATCDDSPTIDDEAAAAVHFATGGVPRLIHQMMRQVLASLSQQAINVELVNRVWSQSRQLASPVLEPDFCDPAEAEPKECSTPTAESSSSEDSIVEFGELSSDDLDESPRSSDPLWEPQAEEAYADENSAQQEPAQQEPVQQEPDPPSSPFEQPVLEDSDVQEPAADDELLRAEDGDKAQPAPSAPAVADTMPEIAAELDRVTDSLLRISDQQYDESDTLDIDSLAVDTFNVGASVQWSLEEPAPTTEESCSPPTEMVEPASLFGDGFEEEEPVPGPGSPVGGPAPVGRPAPVGGPAAVSDSEDDDCQAEHDLHCEVACISVEAATIQLDKVLPPPVRAIGTDGVGAGDMLIDDICLNDDSDMLIIEDVVDIEPAPVRAVVFDDDPSDSVDYQLLLNRMRQG